MSSLLLYFWKGFMFDMSSQLMYIWCLFRWVLQGRKTYEGVPIIKYRRLLRKHLNFHEQCRSKELIASTIYLDYANQYLIVVNRMPDFTLKSDVIPIFLETIYIDSKWVEERYKHYQLHEVFPSYTLTQLQLADSFASSKFGKRAVLSYLGYCIGDTCCSRIPDTHHVDRRDHLQNLYKPTKQ